MVGLMMGQSSEKIRDVTTITVRQPIAFTCTAITPSTDKCPLQVSVHTHTVNCARLGQLNLRASDGPQGRLWPEATHQPIPSFFLSILYTSMPAQETFTVDTEKLPRTCNRQYSVAPTHFFNRHMWDACGLPILLRGRRLELSHAHVISISPPVYAPHRLPAPFVCPLPRRVVTGDMFKRPHGPP